MRLTGTKGEKESADYLISLLNDIKSNTTMRMDILVQTASGSHRFDIMGKGVCKTYTNITNIIAHVHGKNSGAVLLNSHFDSNVKTLGAADDAAAVAIMIEGLRVITQGKELKNSVVFLFNGAEETLQDASLGKGREGNVERLSPP